MHDLARTRFTLDFPQQHQLSAFFNICVGRANRGLSFFLVMHGVHVFIAIFYDPSVTGLGESGEDFTFNSHRLLRQLENIPLKITFFLFRNSLTNELAIEVQYGTVCKRQGLFAVGSTYQRLLCFSVLMLGRFGSFGFSAAGNKESNEKGWYNMFFHDVYAV
ncbi:hypothetical protein BG030_06860 [Pseudomonas putida]|nr:hypothetical protein BG030_06860 [Pseudomonas putida]RNF68017.1 hypothetical protein EFJ98_21645 [Pseudomonas putida]